MKRFLFRLMVVISALIMGCFMIGSAIYTFAWFGFVGKAQEQIDKFWSEAPKEQSIILEGEAPKIKGYPLTPRMAYTGKIRHESGFGLDFPELIYRGFPAPLQLQTISAPRGFTANVPMAGRILKFDSAILEFVPPRRWPKSNNWDDMKAWQKDSDPVIIQNLEFTMGKVNIKGDGVMGLDEALQLHGFANVRVVGMDELLNDLVATNAVQEKDIKIARQFLKMLSQVDEATGQEYFETTLRVQANSFYFGPLRFGVVPDLVWPGAPASTVPQRLKPE